MAADQVNCYAAGCSDYITKPVEMTKLLEAIAQGAAGNQARKDREKWREPTLWPENGASTSSESAAPSAAATRVLVVDDRPVALNATKGLLELHGFDVRTAATGHGAIRVAHEFRPQYIFLDISLPDISGYEVFRQLKGDEHLAGSKFIALSGHGREENMRARKLGFDGYLTKPVNIQEMEKLMNGALADQP
jgi:CheY-like chemotaxis protein